MIYNWKMKIAIHHRPNSYSDLWIKYCQKHNVQYKIVDAYDNDILSQIADCDIFMWHFHHNSYKDYLFAKQLIYVIQTQLGKTTYPDIDTCWHFDDKVGQKYLLEAIDAPFVPTYVFYSQNDALNWIEQTEFPKVFKLRSGINSKNVTLVENAKQAKELSTKAFGNGFQKNSHWIRIAQRWQQYRKGHCTLKWFLKGIVTLYSYKERFNKEEIGYAYFQDFMQDNNFDIRAFLIGNRAVAVKRMNRENDFRASGSGRLIYDKEQISLDYIKTSFEIKKQLNVQSLAIDFLHNSNGQVIVSEISYNCGLETNKDYPGYWTADLQWHECSNVNICDWIIEDLIEKATTK